MRHHGFVVDSMIRQLI